MQSKSERPAALSACEQFPELTGRDISGWNPDVGRPPQSLPELREWLASEVNTVEGVELLLGTSTRDKQAQRANVKRLGIVIRSGYAALLELSRSGGEIPRAPDSAEEFIRQAIALIGLIDRAIGVVPAESCSLPPVPSAIPANPSAIPAKRERIWTVANANDALRKLITTKPALCTKSIRELAKEIGCPSSTLQKTATWKDISNKKPKRSNVSPRPVVTLTSKMTETIGRVERDTVLNKLIQQQEADSEPSPLDDDPPERAYARRVRSFRDRL
jgi:hypothetical protein